MKIKSILLTATILLSGCASPIPTVVALPLPPAVEYPKVEAGSLDCLTDANYKILVKRDRLKSQRIKTLTKIIESTHEN